MGLACPVNVEQDDFSRGDGQLTQRFGQALFRGSLSQSDEGQFILVLTARPLARGHRGVRLRRGGLSALPALFLLLLLHCIKNSSTTLIFQITNEHPMPPDPLKLNIP